MRRSRSRFWAAGKADGGPDSCADKLDAYWTLYECLIEISRLSAPFVPFVTEAIWQNLAVGVFADRVVESVHLCDYPTGRADLLDADLTRRMAVVRDIASLGRAARASAKLKVRQPLAKVEVILADGADAADTAWLESHASIVCDELNVKSCEICQDPQRYIERSVQPDLKKLGPRLGKNLPKVRQAMQRADAAALLAELAASGAATLTLDGGETVSLSREELLVRTTAKSGWAAAESDRAVVVVSAELTEELIAEGLVREVVHAVQSKRKDLELEFTDRIELAFATDAALLKTALERHLGYVAAETLATSASFGDLPNAHREDIAVDGHPLTICIRRVTGSSSVEAAS